MGWDVKATVDTIGQAMPQMPDVTNFNIPENAWTWALAVAGVFVAWWLISPFLQRVWRAAESLMFANWRLALLGTTGLVLSAAAFWTTWDGMHNFTAEPILSAMITFGIQGILLIVSWLIGESFATGMNASGTAGRGNRIAGLAVAVGVFFAATLLILAAAVYGMTSGISTNTWIYGLAAAGSVILLATLFARFSGGDVVKPYTQAVRVVAKNSMLWVMLFACMSMSVFFSFDSRFNAVFPKEERERVAELRATSQVTALLADINASILQQQVAQSEQLFTSTGWNAYETELNELTLAAQGAQGEIERYFNQQIEQRNLNNKEQQERIATAQAGQAGLGSKKQTLTDELARLRSEQPTLSAEYSSKKSDLDNRMKEIDAKRVEAMAEDRGVEGTLKSGKGPEYRARLSELGKLQDYQKIGEQRARDAKKRLDDVNARISTIERELSAVDGELAKFKGEVASAEERISLNHSSASNSDTSRVDPARILPDFEKARSEFRQVPDAAKLATVQLQCNQLYSAMANTPATAGRVKGVDCDPKQASDAAAVVFALNEGNKAFNQNCVGGDKLTQNKSTDGLFSFAKKCLADASLPSAATEELRTKIAFTELTRDDKAHRFVVTWNAFNDGNRLAYLALALAIALDSLIFMSGLFGANAVRSPLSDVPSDKARTAEQLEGIIENALLPETFENARLTLQAMRPITNVDGFMAEVRPTRLDQHALDRVLTVLNAGATIHAVAYDAAEDRYLVRSELFEFLSTTAKKAFEKSEVHANLIELEKIVGVALLPDVGANAETVLHHMLPISEKHGFMAEVKLGEVDPADTRVVRNVLNAGATLGSVQRASEDSAHYFVHKDLYKTIARIRARTFSYGQQVPQIASNEHRGGALRSDNTALSDHQNSRRLLTRLNDVRADEPEYERNLHRNYVGKLLSAIDINPDIYYAMPDEGFAAALVATDAFKRARESNRYLSQKLMERDEDARSAIDAMSAQLQTSGHDAGGLRSADDEINQNWPVFMLLPNGPYELVVSEMLEELEPQAGDGRLSAEESQLYAIVRKMREAFNNPRNSEQSWSRMSQHLNQAANIVHSAANKPDLGNGRPSRLN